MMTIFGEKGTPVLFCSFAMSTRRYFPNKYKDYEGSLGSCESIRERVPRVLRLIEDRCPASLPSEGGLYVGASGIAYAFYHVASKKAFGDRRQELLQKSLQYVQAGLHEASGISPNTGGGIGGSFLLGPAGIYSVSSLVYHALGRENECEQCIKSFLDIPRTCGSLTSLRGGYDELFVGRAGYLCASLLLNKTLGRVVVTPEVTLPLFDTIIRSGQEYSRRYQSPSPLMYSYYDTEYLGAGHGLSSILQILLSFPEHFCDRKDVEQLIRQAVDFVLSCETKDGNYPPVPGELRNERDELVHWCHGAPGVVYMLTKAYLTWKDGKYLQALQRCGELTWQRGLLRKGPGTCHGVAGSGYVFLLLYRLTGEERYLYRALKFADFMETDEFQSGARTPDSPYSLFEGLAGTVCFYADLLEPSSAAFPFFDVFL